MMDLRVAPGRSPAPRLAPAPFAASLLLLAPLAMWTATPPAVAAQTVRVSREEAFRQTAGGKRLGTVMEGAELRAEGREGRWVGVVLEGWIWAPSISATSRGGFDRVVSSPGGENLRVGPSPENAVVARLLPGFLLAAVEERGRWTRVRRSGWVSASAVTTATTADAGAAPEGSAAAPGPEASPAVEGEASPEARGEPAEVRDAPAGLVRSPGGDTAAVVRPGSQLAVLERRDGWARVRLDGWMPVRDLVDVEADSVLADVSAADLEANPEQYRARRVRWAVQFISLERAEAVRTDFYEGEPFILARAPDPSHGFVYLAVPEPLLPQVRELRPLQPIEVLARVRTGRSALMGVPVLELMTIF